jgi:hypothetical protein
MGLKDPPMGTLPLDSRRQGLRTSSSADKAPAFNPPGKIHYACLPTTRPFTT